MPRLPAPPTCSARLLLPLLFAQVTSYMATTNEQMPSLIILEAISSCPFLIKAALAEARGEPGASESDLSEIEAALGLLKVPGWREAEAEGRPPFVRRNLLLLHAHLHRERLGALSLSELTRQASNDVVAKARRLLDMIFSYSLQCGWVKATLTITELQALLVNGLWDHEDDECITSMKHKLTTVGLKMPKIGLRCVASDVGPGEKVRLKVTVSRSHAHSPTEMEAYRQLQRDEAAQQQQVKAQLAEAGGEDLPDITAEEEAEAKEGWWLMVESIRALPIAKVQGIEQSNISHNNLAGKPLGLAPSLDEASVTAEVEFNAPATPGEYKVIVHVRSASMCGVDAKRKVAFMVHAQKAKRSAPSTSSGTSTEPGEGMEDEALQEGAMTAEELKALEAEELKKKQESERKKAAEQEERDAKNAARDAEIAAKGKRAAGGVHKFDPDEVDVHGGNATADDFMDAFGF